MRRGDLRAHAGRGGRERGVEIGHADLLGMCFEPQILGERGCGKIRTQARDPHVAAMQRADRDLEVVEVTT